ncbi:MAG: tetratricopeptide repeat protein [Candidatus Rokubacteria bacterium]|nr:tetratricopeptide repeat protein [Candidatus Rokubacteria bacterium]
MRRHRVVIVLVSAIVLAGCAQLMADSIEALMKQGLELLAARKHDEAIAKFVEVVRRAPRSWDAYLYMARAYVGKGSWSDALASGRKAFDLAPNRADVVPTLAEALLGAGLDALRHSPTPWAISRSTCG